MKYDLIVIGGGPGGYAAAIRAAELGMNPALIECRDLGGTCLNRGCIPTKALMHSAIAYKDMLASETIGINAAGISFDFSRMHAYKDTVVGNLRNGLENLIKGNRIDLIYGQGILQPDGTVKVGDNVYEASDIIIAAGSVPSVPPIPGAGLQGVMTSSDLLEKNIKFSDSLIIIGGGVIGVEMAYIYSALGSRVTVIEALDRVLPMMDRDISQNTSMILKKAGVEIYTSSSVDKIARAEGVALSCTFKHNDSEIEKTAENILVSAGRRPNTENLFAEGVKIETRRGYITVDCNLRTSMPNVYAIGDITGGIQLAHAAEAQGIACAEYISGKTDCFADLSLIPSCVYTNPEIACTGLTADEAKAAGIDVKISKYVMNGNAKTLIEMQPRSFIKLVFDSKTEKLLGAQLMCARATDMISEMTSAISAGFSKSDLLRVIRPHPTFSEAITEAVELADGHSIHSMPSRTGR